MSATPARRLHRAAVGAEALDALRGLALPVVAVVLVGGGGLGRIAVLGVLGVVVAVLAAVVQWSSTRWFLDGETVRLRRGVVGERVVAIPLERVQAVDTVRGPVQRLFGVVELHVQAAGGGRAGEIVLKAVTPADAEELRQAVREAARGLSVHAATTRAASSDEATGWSLGRRELLVAALTSGSLGVLVPVLAGASQLVDDVLDPGDAERLLPTTVQGAALLAAGVLVLAWALSVLGTIVAFAGFRVARDGDRLRIARGVIERRDASVPVGRVHAVRVVESPLREPFGLAQVRVETAGYAGEPATAQTLLPLVRRRDVAKVLGELLPELRAGLEALEPLPRRAARRYALAPLALAGALAVVAVALAGAPGLAALGLVPLGVAAGRARHRAGGWALAGDRLVLRMRGLTRTTATADARRLQAVRISATPFQRRGRLATLAVDVSSGRRLGLRHLDEEAAEALFARLGALATTPPPHRPMSDVTHPAPHPT